MENSKHTKGKWEINPRASLNIICNDKTVANCSSGQNGENLEEEQANAKRIVKVVNCHDELLQALISAKYDIMNYISNQFKANQEKQAIVALDNNATYQKILNAIKATK